MCALCSMYVWPIKQNAKARDTHERDVFYFTARRKHCRVPWNAFILTIYKRIYSFFSTRAVTSRHRCSCVFSRGLTVKFCKYKNILFVSHHIVQDRGIVFFFSRQLIVIVNCHNCLDNFRRTTRFCKMPATEDSERQIWNREFVTEKWISMSV